MSTRRTVTAYELFHDPEGEHEPTPYRGPAWFLRIHYDTAAPETYRVGLPRADGGRYPPSPYEWLHIERLLGSQVFGKLAWERKDDGSWVAGK